MEILRGLDRYPPEGPESVVALGAFDGVHLGHQEVIRTAVARARALGVRAVAATFDPHPLAVLAPAEAPPQIVTLEERLELIGALGPDLAVVIPFTLEFSKVEPEAFVTEILHGRLRALEVVVGFNHTFGRGARGDARLLEELAAPLGLRVHVTPPRVVDEVVVSSSSIRQALRTGDVRAAAVLLGRPYTVRGRVLQGAGRGHAVGFPTANLQPDRPPLLARGVYAGRAGWEGGSADAVINVGVRPTFGEGELWVEAYLLDFSGALYGKTLTLAFLARIRDEQRFTSVDALRARIREDVAEAARLLDRHR